MSDEADSKPETKKKKFPKKFPKKILTLKQGFLFYVCILLWVTWSQTGLDTVAAANGD